MHIPDGFISTGTAAVTWVASAGGIGYAVRRVNRELSERQVPLMGVTAAFIFAAQMMNFTVVVAVQALLFQDGGLLALGANVLNMALITVFVGWLVYSSLKRLLGKRSWATMVSGFAAAWLSVVLASMAAAVELAVSGTSPLAVALPAMGLVHMLIGVGEGLITVAVLVFLQATRPDLLSLRQASSHV